MRNKVINSLFIVLMLIIVQVCAQIAPACHYTCSTCWSTTYYSCLTCPPNRGLQPDQPFAGMCYCSESTDQNQLGQCTVSSQFNYNNKSMIAAFIGVSLFLSVFMLLVRGMRYYLVKIIEDVQELSLIVFINLYFPQQFDIFLSIMYRFNISSYTFESMASGSLFTIQQGQGVVSTDGSNIDGKFKLLYKTANFFSNQFTWMIVFVLICIFMLILRFLKNRFMQQQKSVRKVSQERTLASIQNDISLSQLKCNQSFFFSQNISQIQHNSPDKIQVVQQKYQILKHNRAHSEVTFKNLVIKLYNILWFNFIIMFFYLSLVEININVFTQMSNLTFSSSFSATGAFFSALFLALEIVVLVLLFLKCKQQLVKPQWMRDHSFSAIHYMIRTNFKPLTKYFFFFCCIKKVLFALVIVVCYDSPSDAILGIFSIQAIFLGLSMYLEPFQKRHVRLHFYLCEAMKMFFFISLINFVEKYKEFSKLIEITKILFFMLACIFGFHFVTIILHLLIQGKIYLHQMRLIFKKFCGKKQKQEQTVNSDKQENQQKVVVGYFHQVLQKQDNQTSPQTPKMTQNNDKELNLSKADGQQELQQQQNQQNQQIVVPKKYFYVYKEYLKKQQSINSQK